MSRRNQSRRRRSYGRRQHEIRQRRPDEGAAGSEHDFDQPGHERLASVLDPPAARTQEARS